MQEAAKTALGEDGFFRLASIAAPEIASFTQQKEGGRPERFVKADYVKNPLVEADGNTVKVSSTVKASMRNVQYNVHAIVDLNEKHIISGHCECKRGFVSVFCFLFPVLSIS